MVKTRFHTSMDVRPVTPCIFSVYQFYYLKECWDLYLSTRLSPDPWHSYGTKTAVSFANIFMAKIETAIIDQHNTEPLSSADAPAKYPYCWFSHDVTKIQTTKLSIQLRFYFHGVLKKLKTNFQTNFRFTRVLGFVIKYAWTSKLLRHGDAAFTWRPRELSFGLKKWLFSKNFAI